MRNVFRSCQILGVSKVPASDFELESLVCMRTFSSILSARNAHAAATPHPARTNNSDHGVKQSK